MKKTTGIAIFAALMLLMSMVLTGCGKPNASREPEPTSVGGLTPAPTAIPQPTEPPRNFRSAYTGEAVDEASAGYVPYLAVIENMKAARPQSGLSEADIVFETLAEGGIPRFIALFQSKRPKEIGPIRSDRVYFNEIAKSLDLPFAHCGGSQASIDQIHAQKLMSMDQFFNGKYYWRNKNRYAPHNLYTSSEKLEQLISKKGYERTPEFNLEFDEDNNWWQENGEPALNIDMRLSGYYSTAYRFKNGYYYKTMNNVAVKDKNNGEQLKAKNVIVQTTSIRQIANDPKHRVEIGLTGSGNGYLFSNGRYMKIRWVKDNSRAKVQITDMAGSPVKLGVGNTWWEIVDGSCSIAIDQTASKTTKKKNQ